MRIGLGLDDIGYEPDMGEACGGEQAHDFHHPAIIGLGVAAHEDALVITIGGDRHQPVHQLIFRYRLLLQENGAIALDGDGKRLAVLAQRLGTVWASASTWYRLVRRFAWRRPRLRVHPVKPKIGLRTTRPNEMWHIDTTVIRLLDGTRAYLHAVIDNFSRRILAWRVAETFAPVNSVAVLLDASRAASPSDTAPVVLADAGVENVNAQVDELITTGVLRRVLAFTELRFSNSMIEAWWRSLKQQWLFLHSLDSVTTVRRLVEFYVDEHNRVLPHSAFRGQTPDEMYFGTGDTVPADLTSGAAAARRARAQANRSAACETCPSLDTAA